MPTLSAVGPLSGAKRTYARAANWPVFTDGCMPEGGIARRYCADLCDSPDDFLDGLVDATTHPQIQIYPRGVGRQQGPTP